MTTTLCGHNRADLVWALGGEHDALPSCGCASPKCLAQLAVDDPAKLAELMAEICKEFGLDCRSYGTSDLMGEGVVFVIHGHVWLRRVTMPQARAFVLSAIQKPKGTPVADVLKALEVAP